MGMQMGSVCSYLTSTVKTPYFLFISDGQYLSAIDELRASGLAFVSMSSFCSGSDKLPDIDGLLSHIEAADVNADGKKFVVTGLGEFLALRGADEAIHTLSRLKDLNAGGAKVILLIRGLAPLIAVLESDLRFDSRRHSVVDKAECDLSFTLAAPSIGLSALTGFKAMLTELENGRTGNIVVSTAANLDHAMFTVHHISSAYEGIIFSARGFALACSCGTDAQWAELLTELNQSGSSLDAVFEKHGFSGNLESDFYSRITGSDYCNWLYYICLKCKAATLQNGYLRYALGKAERFEEFTGHVLNAIIEIPHTDRRFAVFYLERKALVEKFPESDIADFVVNSRQVVAESIYKLTDGTKPEREEIIAWLSRNGLIPQLELENIYPALAAYLKKYVFKCPDLAELLTEYFEAYKRQKLSNQLEPEFLEKVDELAISRQFNRLPTRNEILDGVEKDGIYLYWLDALGVEYLSLIENLVQRRGLSIHVSIARAELPTITSVNRAFFDTWKGRKEKNGELDDIKHNDTGGYNFIDNEMPIHLARELDVITAIIDKAATELALKHCKRFLIVSDHGASRLAVLRRKEEKYDTDTSGEHSGRCCKLFEPYALPFAAEENGYLVLADYGRFKGSRAANVEVHGGASLEEVVVPVIELALKDGSITVKLVSDMVTVDFRTGTVIKLFVNSPVQDVSVVLNGKRYTTVQIDENHHSAKLPDTKRAGDYPADVYAGDNLIGKIMIKAQSKSGKVNDAFDDLF
jgi:hypothetical protein